MLTAPGPAFSSIGPQDDEAGADRSARTSANAPDPYSLPRPMGEDRRRNDLLEVQAFVGSTRSASRSRILGRERSVRSISGRRRRSLARMRLAATAAPIPLSMLTAVNVPCGAGVQRREGVRPDPQRTRHSRRWSAPRSRHRYHPTHDARQHAFHSGDDNHCISLGKPPALIQEAVNAGDTDVVKPPRPNTEPDAVAVAAASSATGRSLVPPNDQQVSGARRRYRSGDGR